MSSRFAQALRDGTVPCVGGCMGRCSDSAATRRALIEKAGGRFAHQHHDAEKENNVRQLYANLATADLVTCQTGCISHHAGRRAREHCKRHNKRGVFLDDAGMPTLARGPGMPPSPAACIHEPEASRAQSE